MSLWLLLLVSSFHVCGFSCECVCSALWLLKVFDVFVVLFVLCWYIFVVSLCVC